jgi:hypothetical protein
MGSFFISDISVWRGRTRPRNAYSRIGSAGNFYNVLALAALLAALVPSAVAQKTTAHAPARPAIRRSSSKTSLSSARQPHSSQSRRSSSPLTSLLAPFFGDSFNPDDFAGNDSAASQPSGLLQAANALSGSDLSGHSGSRTEPPSSSNQPLMIELQGDRYVRVNSAAINGEALPLTLAPDNIHQNLLPAKSTRNHSTRSATPNPSAAQPPMVAALSPPRDLPPAVLVFQDGHSEEVREYTIADGFLYARGDFYTDGYWNKKIDLSSLNLPQTQQANSTRNVKFALPAFPNEVITRP